MLSFNIICIIFGLLVSLTVLTCGDIRFTNVKCTVYDPSFLNFEQCELKVLRRGVIGINIWAKFHQLPINNITANISLHKKLNGYRPFLYNVTIDFCQFSRNRAKYPLFKMVLDTFLSYSNINHSCPYDHDIIVRNCVLKEDAFRLFPMPSGDYAFLLKVAFYNDWKVDVKVHFNIKD